MLVLTRRVGEEIVIGDDIHVTVTAVHGNKVRLGITAPTFVPVMRPELLSSYAPADRCGDNQRGVSANEGKVASGCS